MDKVSVAVTAWVPVMAGAGLTEQAGESVAKFGPWAMAQDSATVPVKPPLGVIVMVEVPLAPGAEMLMAVPVKANWPTPEPVAGGAMVRSTVVEALCLPEVPLTFSV